MKKITAFILLIFMCFTIASCGNNTPPVGTDGGGTTANVPSTPPVSSTENGEGCKWVSVGKFVTLVFNNSTCDANWTVKQDVGSKESVTITAVPKKGFSFDGWSIDSALANSKQSRPESPASTELTYSLSTNTPTKIFLNTSATLLYHKDAGSSDVIKQESFSMVYYQRPNTMPLGVDYGKSGYTLTGYSTEPNGNGYCASIGGKVPAESGQVHLYPIFEKQSPASDFATIPQNSSVTITKYKGTDPTVVIPESINGARVTSIAEGAFQDNTSLRRVVLPSSLTHVDDFAFENCSILDTVVLFDKSIDEDGISDDFAFNCPKLKNLRVNTSYTLNTDSAVKSGFMKFDRLIWAKDKKKVVIVGGSGSLLGFDGEAFYNALGKEYEIVNLGENASINAVLYFDLLEDLVKEGDIILWCPEPTVYNLGSRTTGYTTYWEFHKSDLDFLKYVDVSRYDDLFSTFSKFAGKLKSAQKQSFDSGYANVDGTGCDMSVRSWNGSVYEYNFNFRARTEKSIVSLMQNIKDKGAKIYFSIPPIQTSGFESYGTPEEDIISYIDYIQTTYGVPSISEYTRYFVTDELMYNSAWHLSNKGCTLRSQMVAQDILAQLAKESNHEHSWSTIQAVEPSCEEDGCTEGAYCTICGVYSQKPTKLLATGHTPILVGAIQPACNTIGFTVGRKCTNCDKLLTERTQLGVLPHKTVLDAGKTPTKDSDGLSQGSHCTVCGQTIVPQFTLPKLSSPSPDTSYPFAEQVLRKEVDGWIYLRYNIWESATVVKPFAVKYKSEGIAGKYKTESQIDSSAVYIPMKNLEDSGYSFYIEHYKDGEFVGRYSPRNKVPDGKIDWIVSPGTLERSGKATPINYDAINSQSGYCTLDIKFVIVKSNGSAPNEELVTVWDKGNIKVETCYDLKEWESVCKPFRDVYLDCEH